MAAGLLVVDVRKKTIYFNHGFNDRGFSKGNGTFGSESSVSNGKSAVITVSALSGPSGRLCPVVDFREKHLILITGLMTADFQRETALSAPKVQFQMENPRSLP